MIRCHFVLIVLSLLWINLMLFAQERYAIDASQGCRGVVLADSALSPGAAWTGEAWVYLKDDLAPNQIIFRTDHEPGNFSMGVYEGRMIATLTLTSSFDVAAFGQTPLPLGDWTHLAACYELGEMQLYLNGEEDGLAVGPGNPAFAPGPIFIGGGEPTEQLFGLLDEIRLSDTVRYAGDFDPFHVPLLVLRVGDQLVSGWSLGSGPFSLMEAWDYQTLYAIIDGSAEVYISYNFQYAMLQKYHGQIGGHDVDLELWITDQGSPGDAEALFNDPLMVPPFHVLIDTIGEEARVDTGLLWDYMLDFWRDKYYVSVTLNKEWGPQEALQVAMDFGAQTDINILNQYQHTSALWQFNEGSGTVFSDVSGHGHHGTLMNPAWVEVEFPQPVLYITLAQLLEGNIQNLEIDEDDTAVVAFSQPVVPITINSGNLNEILQLSVGHSWLSGSGQLGSAAWNDTWDTLKIGFSLQGGAPTVANGDTLFPNPDSLISVQDLHAGGYRFIRFEEISKAQPNNPPPVPEAVKLFPPYPTPFNALACIAYELPQSSWVVMKVWNIAGREVDVLYEGFCQAGMHSAIWNSENHASGVYLITLKAGVHNLVKKTVLIK